MKYFKCKGCKNNCKIDYKPTLSVCRISLSHFVLKEITKDEFLKEWKMPEYKVKITKQTTEYIFADSEEEAESIAYGSESGNEIIISADAEHYRD